MTAPAPIAARAPDDARDGFVLVAVLWILAALAAFVSVYALYTGSSVAAASVREEALSARTLATGAVELAAFRLLHSPAGTPGTFAYRMGNAGIAVTFRSEAARIDLNAAPPEVLSGLFTALGATEAEAERYARRILGWRAPTSDAEESGIYRDAGLAYGPRAAPFVHADELWRVAGLPADMVEAALPHVTVYSGRAQPDMREAGAVVTAAMAAAASGTGPEPDGPSPGPQAGTPLQDAPAQAVRVWVSVSRDSGRTRDYEAVILLREFTDAPFRVLAWREGVDIPGAMPAARAEGRP